MVGNLPAGHICTLSKDWDLGSCPFAALAGDGSSYARQTIITEEPDVERIAGLEKLGRRDSEVVCVPQAHHCPDQSVPSKPPGYSTAHVKFHSSLILAAGQRCLADVCSADCTASRDSPETARRCHVPNIVLVVDWIKSQLRSTT